MPVVRSGVGDAGRWNRAATPAGLGRIGFPAGRPARYHRGASRDGESWHRDSWEGPKICLIGAGGMSFGPVMVLDAIKTRRTRGATMMLHDVSPERLEVARRFATRVNQRNGSPIRIETSLDPAEAMTGADFCLTSAEIGRWQHWIEDYEVPVPLRLHPDHR